LQAVSDIVARPPGPAWFEAWVADADAVLGADHAWIVLDAPRPLADDCPAVSAMPRAHVVAASSARAQAVSVEHWKDTGRDSFHATLLGEDGIECLSGAQARFADSPALRAVGAQACVACPLRDTDGAPCGYLALAFDRPIAAGSGYAPALRILAAFASHAIVAQPVMANCISRLREVVAQYQVLFHDAPVLINAFGPDGKCTLWNKACQQRFGWTLEEINRHDEPIALFYPDPEVRARVIASIGPEPDQDFAEFHPRTRGGEELTTLWSNVRLPSGEVVNIGMDITERKRAERVLTRMAKVDSLTDCWNRAEILRQLTEVLARPAPSTGEALAIVMLDVDHFKQVNDGYGHLMGDRALRHFCEQVKCCLGDSGKLGRLGGEEFLVLRPGGANAAMVFFEKLMAALRANPLDLDQHALTLSASGGITVRLAGDRDVSDMLSRADSALYQAKAAGRGRAVVYG